MRIEWAKALARKMRWTEEVYIVEEEMRRVLRTLDHEIRKWRKRADHVLLQHLREDEASGRRAYGMRQASSLSHLKKAFEFLWLRSEPSRGKEHGVMDEAALVETRALFSEDLDQAAVIPEIDYN